MLNPHFPTFCPNDHREVIVRCDERAKEMVRYYENKPNPTSGDGIEKNHRKQMLAAQAECMVCLYRGLPFESLRWWKGATQSGDKGRDMIDRGLKVEVKHTERGWRLIWPVYENHQFDDADFEAMVLVSGNENEMWLRGWETKPVFKAMRRTATGILPRGMHKGTWYMEELRPMDQIKFYTGELC